MNHRLKSGIRQRHRRRQTSCFHLYRHRRRLLRQDNHTKMIADNFVMQ
jgi:hypothetical protein